MKNTSLEHIRRSRGLVHPQASVFLLFVLPQVAVSVVSAQELSSIRGRVVDSANKPIAAVEVTLLPLSQTYFSSEDGSFRFMRVIRGSYRLRLRRPGYSAVDTLVFADSKNVEPIQIVLRELPVRLPSLEVEASLPTPPRSLIPGTNTGKGLASGVKAPILPFGASMSDGASALIRMHTKSGPKGTTSRVGFRQWYEGLGGFASFGYGGACEGNSDALATLVEDPPGVVTWVLDSTLQVHRGTLNPGDQCTKVGSFTLAGIPMAAAGIDGGWVVYRLTPEGVAHLTYIQNAGGIGWDFPLDHFHEFATANPVLAMAPTRVGVTIADRSWPFGWIEIGSDGVVLRTGTVDASVIGVDSSRLTRGRAYSVLRLENGFVQTIEGQSGKDRRIVFYDVLGRMKSQFSPSNCPILIASAPNARRLLGIRNRNAIGSIQDLYEYIY